jgi:hypothetical protein
LIKGRPSTTTTNNNNNKAKCIPGGTLRVLAGKNSDPRYKAALVLRKKVMTFGSSLT